MPVNCTSGCGKRAILKRPKTGDALCKECFFFAFEKEVHHTITSAKLFSPGEYVAIAASGGKDSTVLAHLMTLLNERYQYGLRLVLLSIDEGIAGYRDDSLETVKRNEKQYRIPLKILSYEELYGWTMDKIVQKVGRRNNCTFCGVFRRQALDRGARQLGVHKLVTGHNADDIAETIVMNVLRGDVARLQRCCAVETGSEGQLPRSKPFKYTYEKEIVMYAYFKKLDYFSTECIYSPNAYRGHARAYIKDLEKIRPSAIIDIIHSGECLLLKEDVRLPTQTQCSRCGHVSSQAVCKACVLLEGLNKGRPRLGVGKSSKVKQKMNATPDDLVGDVSETETKSSQGLSTVNAADAVGDVSEIGTKMEENRDLPVDNFSVVNGTSENNHRTSSDHNFSMETHQELRNIASNFGVVGKTNNETDIYASNDGSPTNSQDGQKSKNITTHNNTSGHNEISNGGTEGRTALLNATDVNSLKNGTDLSMNHTVDHNNVSSATAKITSEAGAGKSCGGQLTSIEDIGDAVTGRVCGSGGVCSGDCKTKEKKKRKVVSLRANPELALKAAGLSKKDLDF